MPIPTPTTNEKSGTGTKGKSAFMKRCMSSEVMKREFPNKDQHVAICLSQWKKRKKKKKAKGSQENPTWDECEYSDEIFGGVILI